MTVLFLSTCYDYCCPVPKLTWDIGDSRGLNSSLFIISTIKADRTISTGVSLDKKSRFCYSLVFLLGWFLHLNLLHLAEEFQAQFVNQRLNLTGHFRGDVPLDVQEGAAVPQTVGAEWPQPFPKEPVGNVDLGLEVFRRGAALQDIGDGDVEVRDGLEFLRPLGEAIDIRKGGNLPGAQDGELLGLELRFSAGG